MHAQAATMTSGVELVGVGGGARAAGELAAAAEVPDLPLDTLIDRSEVLIVAVPPMAASEVAEAMAGRVGAVLFEAPALDAIGHVGCPAMVGANLLHAPAVRRGLRAVSELHQPHHLALRSSQPAPTWGAHGTVEFGGAASDPGVRLAPVLLAAAGSPAVSATAEITGHPVEESALIRFHLDDGRSSVLNSHWAAGSARAELEVADESGAILVSLLPEPSLELNGNPVALDHLRPLVALGFVPQIERLVSLGRGGGNAWLELSTGLAINELITRAVAVARAESA